MNKSYKTIKLYNNNNNNTKSTNHYHHFNSLSFYVHIPSYPDKTNLG